MIGIWNTVLQTPFAKLKVIFTVEKHEAYRLTVKTEPLPMNIEFNMITVEGNRLRASGHYKFFSEEAAEVELTFEGEVFSGILNLHPLGTLQFEGQKGEGASLAAVLMDEVQKYRKVGTIRERTEEEIRDEVEKLLNRMTILDKVGQMSQCLASNFAFGGDVESDPPEKLVAEGKVGSILGAFDINRVFELQRIAIEQSPLRIPLLFNADIIHGHQTIFPVPLAWSSSWDMDGIKRACAISAKEASASGITYNYGPMVDVTRDARWGRVVEGAGEDPYLGSLIAKAQVEGFQGDSLFSEETIIACLKHFIAYGAAEGCKVDSEIDGGLEEAVRQARQADTVILALGESSDMSGEAASRMDIELPEVQRRLAEEIVQLYIQDLNGSVVRPVKELKGFEKIYLNPGESREVTFEITEEDLKYYTADMTYQAEAGEFKIYIGTNSKEVKEAAFELII